MKDLGLKKTWNKFVFHFFSQKFPDFGLRKFPRPAGWKENFNVRVTACAIQTGEGKSNYFLLFISSTTHFNWTVAAATEFRFYKAAATCDAASALSG